jgi:uncharacterized phiE125 gp8 family phage protein
MSETFCHHRLTPELVTGPTIEPITVAEAKKQLEIATSDDTHDAHICDLITAARQQWEADTDTCVNNQTWKVITEQFYDGMKLPKRPIQSITSITYYDGNNTQQTLSTSKYQLHIGTREIKIAFLQVLPVSLARWDAWTITYLCGYGSTAAACPGVAKRAMMFLIGYQFENRDQLMNDVVYKEAAYERLVSKYLRSDYP